MTCCEEKKKEIEKLTILYSQSVELREKYKTSTKSLEEELAMSTRRLEEQKKAFEVQQVELKTALMIKYGDEKRSFQYQIDNLLKSASTNTSLGKAVNEKLDQLDNYIQKQKNEMDEKQKIIKASESQLQMIGEVKDESVVDQNPKQKTEQELTSRIGLLRIEIDIFVKISRHFFEKTVKYQAYCKKLEDNLQKSQQFKATDDLNFKKQLEMIQKQLDQSQTTVSTLTADFSTSKKDHQKTNQQLESLIESSKEQDAQYQKLKKKLESTTQSLSYKDKLLMDLTEQNAIQTSLINDLNLQMQKSKEIYFAETAQLISQIAELKKQLENCSDQRQQLKRQQDLELDLEVLQEMARGNQAQLKSKDNDIQRLQIKIKRLEKQAEINQQIQKYQKQDQQQQREDQRFLAQGSPQRQQLLVVEQFQSQKQIKRSQDQERSLQTPSMLPPISKGSVGSIVDGRGKAISLRETGITERKMSVRLDDRQNLLSQKMTLDVNRYDSNASLNLIEEPKYKWSTIDD